MLRVGCSFRRSSIGLFRLSTAAKRFEDIYEKKSQIDHILLRPDTYVGSTEPAETNAYVWNSRGKEIEYKTIKFVPALYKIVDEILVNAVDNFRRPNTGTNEVRVSFDEVTGRVTVYNNGKGVPIVMHQKEKVYIPELVFGHLLTGSNFDDTESKFTGGRNGFGAKLTNVFSSEFQLSTADSLHKLAYAQVWRGNMKSCETPVIEGIRPGQKDFTEVSFVPDFEKLGIRSTPLSFLRQGTTALLRRRVLDLAACNRGLQVFLNDEPVGFSGFEEYVSMYYRAETKHREAVAKNSDLELDDRSSNPVSFAYAKLNPFWEIAVGSALREPHISFCNSIFTSRGGTHVNEIFDQVCSKLVDHLARKHRMKVSKASVRNQLSVFVNAMVPNPAFDSQTKETLTTKPSVFATEATISDVLFQKMIGSCGIVDDLVDTFRVRQLIELDKKSSTRSKVRLKGVEKLDDANLAGTSRGRECTLILTEGDSAKALAVSGLSVVGRDRFGVFPLKGKLVNVRDASFESVLKNEELNNIKTILGLSHSCAYETPEERQTLRYGRVMLMCDQDHDGSHIKGLFINMLHHYWPALLRSGTFLEEFITPLIKVTGPRSQALEFFTARQYQQWRETIGEDAASHFRVKYYKGLGTSTAEEGRKYFQNLDKLRVVFRYEGVADDAKIQLAFEKSRADDRKRWLETLTSDTFVDHSLGYLTFGDFIDRELILFSHANNIRAIPNIMDGLKPGQRKVLYACFKKNLTQEIKVAQLSGYVAEQTQYHHGEQSLQGTIVNMAQNFVGCGNNIHVLEPNGQFGTRLAGGSDAASPRYIFTKLNPVTRLIFRSDDDPILDRRFEDGEEVEPVHYAPTIPMLLVNGCQGVGTGYSTDIPSFNPLEVVENVERFIRGLELISMVPYFHGFKGSIHETGAAGRFVTRGTYMVTSPNTVEITELPIGRWVDDYKLFLESLSGVSQIEEFHTDSIVRFRVKFDRKTLTQLLSDDSSFVKAMKLETTLSSSNMHAFSADNTVISRYSSPLDIIKVYCPVRLELYQKRKAHLQTHLQDVIHALTVKVRFIELVCAGLVPLAKAPRADVASSVRSHFTASGYGTVTDSEIDTMLSLPLSSLTLERKTTLEKELEARTAEYNAVSKTAEHTMWLRDLAELRKTLTKLGYSLSSPGFLNKDLRS